MCVQYKWKHFNFTEAGLYWEDLYHRTNHALWKARIYMNMYKHCKPMHKAVWHIISCISIKIYHFWHVTRYNIIIILCSRVYVCVCYARQLMEELEHYIHRNPASSATQAWKDPQLWRYIMLIIKAII